MKNKILRKGLVVGIIALFIGLAFIPSFNAISISKSDDTTPPVIEVSWETYKFNSTWYVKFDCEIYDNESGIDRTIWYLNGVLQDSNSGPGPDYGFHFTVTLYIAKKSVFKFEAINGAGLSAFVEIDGSDIKSTKDCDCQSNSKTHLAEKLLNKLEKDEVLSKVIKSINPKDDRLICEILWNIYERYTAIADYYYEKKEDYELGTFWYNIYLYIFTIYFMISAIPIIIGAAVFGCWGPYPY